MLDDLRQRFDRWNTRRIRGNRAKRGVVVPASEAAPVSYQESPHNPLSSVDAASGVVRTKRGAYVAVFEANGVPVDAMSADDAEAFCTRWAQALNSLPAGHLFQFVARARRGGLDGYLLARREALGRHSGALWAGAGMGTAQAVLERDQVAHLERLNTTGGAQTVTFYVVAQASDPETLRERGAKAIAWMRSAGVGGRLVKGPELMDALSWYFRDGPATHWLFDSGAGWVVQSDEGRAEAHPAKAATAETKGARRGFGTALAHG